MADSLADRLADLEALSTTELRARWEQAIKRSVPKRASRDLLRRALAYHMQEQTEGGLSKSTRRRLAKLTGLNGENREPFAPIRHNCDGGVHQKTRSEPTTSTTLNLSDLI